MGGRYFVHYLTSQSPTSGRCDHLSPVWFQILAIRQQTSTAANELTHVNTLLHVTSLVCPFLLSSMQTLLSSVNPRYLLLTCLYASSPEENTFWFSLMTVEESSDGKDTGWVWLPFKVDRLKCSRPIRRQTETVRKYHVWCSSSTKLLDSRLMVWNTVPPSRNRPTTCWRCTWEQIQFK